jgi:hypothetical protein
MVIDERKREKNTTWSLIHSLIHTLTHYMDINERKGENNTTWSSMRERERKPRHGYRYTHLFTPSLKEGENTTWSSIHSLIHTLTHDMDINERKREKSTTWSSILSLIHTLPHDMDINERTREKTRHGIDTLIYSHPHSRYGHR